MIWSRISSAGTIAIGVGLVGKGSIGDGGSIILRLIGYALIGFGIGLIYNKIEEAKDV